MHFQKAVDASPVIQSWHVAFHSSVKNPSKQHPSQAVPLQSSTDEPFPTWETCACISRTLAMHNWNKGKMSSSVLMKREELQIYSAALEWRQPSFWIPPLPMQESVLQKPPHQNTTQQEQVVHQPNIPSDAEQAANCPCQSTRWRADGYCSPENSRRVVHLLPLATALGHCPLCCLQG